MAPDRHSIFSRLLLLLFLLPCAEAYGQRTITTFAGGEWKLYGEAGPATAVPLGSFLGITSDPKSNRIVIGDSGNRAILDINANGILSILGGLGTTSSAPDGTPARSALFTGPVVVFDPEGRILFAENDRIRAIDTDGRIQTITNAGGIPIQTLTFDKQGKLYLSNGRSIARLTNAGNWEFLVGPGNVPNAPDGSLATSLLSETISGPTFDAEGRIVFSDVTACRIRRVNADGRLETIAGTDRCASSPDGSVARTSPLSLNWSRPRFLGDGRLAISDSGRIRLVTTGGLLTSLTGPPATGFSPLVSTPFFDVRTMDVTSAGELVFEDLITQRVMGISLGGILRHIAGNGCFQPPAPRPTSALEMYFNGGPSLSSDGRGGLFASTIDPRSVFRIRADGISQLTYGQTASACKAFGSVPVIPSAGPGSGFTQVDEVGNTYLMDVNGVSIFRINPDAPPTLIAGARPTPSTSGITFSGEGILATEAIMRAAPQFWRSAQGEIWIADAQNERVRKIDRSGRIRTVAGTGTAGFSGDNGPATLAKLNRPSAVAGDGLGNVYIADTNNHVVRRINADGTIVTIAGTGRRGGNGDGGQAVLAELDSPQGLWIDIRRNEIYIAGENRVRRINADGTIEAIAGTGIPGYSGDGTPATLARLNNPRTMFVDEADVLYIGDTGNRRIRRVQLDQPALTGAECEVSVSRETIQTSSIESNGQFLLLAKGGCQVSGASNSSWLRIVSGQNGAGSRAVVYEVGQNNSGSPRTGVLRFANRSILVFQAANPALRVEPASIQATGIAGRNLGTRTLRVRLAAVGGPLRITLANTTDREQWLQLPANTGVVSATAPLDILIQMDTTSLTAGTYRGQIEIYAESTGESVKVPVTIALSARAQLMRSAHEALSFRSPQGSSPAPQSFPLANHGTGVLNWTTATVTTSGGRWLSVTPASGSLAAGESTRVAATVNPIGLAAGDYYGQIELKDVGNNIVKQMTVGFSVSAGSNPSPLSVDRAQILFQGAPAAAPPTAQNIELFNGGTSPVNYSATADFRSTDAWFTISPATGSVAPGQRATITLTPNPGGRTAGLFSGDLIINSPALSNAIRLNAQLLLVAGLTTAGVAPPGCRPSRLLPIIEAPAPQFWTQSGWALPIRARLFDDCGAAVTEGEMLASLTGSGTVIPLSHFGAGLWTATSTLRETPAGPATLSLRAIRFSNLAHSGTTAVDGVIAKPLVNAPTIGQNAVLNAASFERGGPLSAGVMASVFGTQLSKSFVQASSIPLPIRLDESSATVSGLTAPLYVVSSGQVNLQIPFELATDTDHWLVIRNGNALSVPQPFVVAAASPAVFTVDGSGGGQASAYGFVTGEPVIVAGLGGARASDTLVAFAVGLGPVSPAVASGQASPTSAATLISPLKLTIAGRPAEVLFAGLAPGFVGLYQINFKMPDGLPPASTVPLELEVSGVRSPVTFIATAELR